MIVIDSSALVAIAKGEPEAEILAATMSLSLRRVMSAVNYVEAGTVLAGRRAIKRGLTADEFDRLLSRLGVEIEAVTEDLAREALKARIKYGKGFGTRKGLNFGDCFAYALAKAHGAPLLFVGDDFARTDVKRALG